jgi:hypothetical protein
MADDDPYAISSDSDDELPKGPPPKIAIEGRAADISSLKAALNAEKEFTKDESRIEEIAGLKEKDKYSKFKDKFEKITGAANEATGADNDDDDSEYAVVSKPKQTDAAIVRSGMKCDEDLSNISSLAEKKGNWQSSVADATKVEKLTVVEQDTIQAGRVKANLTKFIEGVAAADEDVDNDADVDDDDGNGDQKIVRSSRKKPKEQLHFEQVGDLKKKWKTGEIDTTTESVISEDRSSELDELKRGPKVKERFQERQEPDVVERSYDKESVDTSLSSEARKSFLQGAAFESGPVEKSVKDDIKFAELGSVKERFEKGVDETTTEKTSVDVHCAELENIKAAFEKGTGEEGEMTAEERAELKKRQIEAEFIRYKLARRQKQMREGENAEVDDQSGAAKIRPENEVEFKVAAKAREKFNKIDAKAQSKEAKTETEHASSKWDKDTKNTIVPEPINRRAEAEDFDDEDDDDAFEVKNLKNKFENIVVEKKAPSSTTKPDIDVSVEAKELKARFESTTGGQDNTETLEERRKRLEIEFKQYKEQKELEKQQEQPIDETPQVASQREEIEISADHASKMTAKWEKIHKKEAKKAQRSQMPAKAGDKTAVAPDR